VTTRTDRARERQQDTCERRERAHVQGVDEVDGRRLWLDERHLNPDGTRKTARDTHKSTQLRERHRARTTCTIRENHYLHDVIILNIK
jgi:hypothetical protein